MADPGYNFTPNTNPASVADQQRARILQVLKGPASWFLMIAGLSVVNSVLAMTGTGIRFIFGLGASQFVDAMAHRAGSTGYVLDFVINGIIAGVFVLFWNFAKKGQTWAWYVAMALYAIDGLLLLLFKDYLAIAFHAYALYRMSAGLKLLPMLKSLDQQTGTISSSF